MKNTSLVALIISTVFANAAFATKPDTPNNNKKTITANLIPETQDNKFSIGLAAGTTIPLGGFAASGAASDSTHINGSAQTGIHFNATASYKIYKIIGAMVMVGGNINSYNAAASGFAAATVPSGPHYVGQYMAGPYVSIPVGKKFFIEARALVGLITSHYPELTEGTSVSFSGFVGANVSIDTKLKSGAAFGYSGSVGAKYMFSNHFGLTLNVAYSGSNMKYPSYTIHTVETASSILSAFSSTPLPNVNTTTTHNTPIHMSLGMINISAGAAYSF
jgi:hypothetical protein